MNTTLGNVVVDISGAGAGDYTYTLNTAGSNNTTATASSITEVINYDANSTDAALRVSIIDDAPTAVNAVVSVPESVVPSYTLMLVLDVSGSMAAPYGAVKQVNADGSVTTTDRLTLAKSALEALVDEYFNQSPDVQVKLITFSDSATVFNSGNAYTSKAAAIAAIESITGTGGTNYEAAANAVQNTFGTVDASRQNYVYFLSDGVPSVGGTTNPITATYSGTGRLRPVY